MPRQNLPGCGVSTPLQAFVCICTIKSELTRVLIWVQMSEPGSISADFLVGGSKPDFNQEDFSVVQVKLSGERGQIGADPGP